MSKDLVAFDPSGVTPIPAGNDLLDYIHDAVGDGDPCPRDAATEKIGEVIRWAGQQYGSTVDSHSQWTSWPPTLLADGRHCTFNLSLAADSTTFLMDASDQCKRLGLVLIDPSGRNPLVTTPDGGGILD